MKWIYIGIICFCSVGSLTAQDSLKIANKTKSIFSKIKPIVSVGYKNQSLMETNGGGSYINAGLTLNKSYKITFGSEFSTATFGYYDVNNILVIFENFSISQKNIGFSYILKDYRVLHPAFNLKFTNTQIIPDITNEIIKFKGIKPGVDLQLNLNRFFRFTIGVARNISLKNSGIPNGVQLGGNEFSFGIEFSRFKK